MKEQLSKHTLFNFFSGQASPLQKRLIEDWLTQSANTEKYYEWLEEWEEKHPQFIPDMEHGLEQYLRRMSTSDKPVIYANTIKSLGTFSTRWIGYAAAIILLFASTLYLSYDFFKYETFTTDFAEVRTLVLDDGSKVSLNANSFLKVPRFGFGKKTREVFLYGEAEFSVVHEKNDTKFLVHTTDHLEVEVVGTEFIVYSRTRGSKVVLNKGKILLRSLTDTTHKTLAVKPGDVVTVHQGAFRIKEKQKVQAHAAWKEHRFVFDHTPLTEIAFQVEENFGLKMQINDTLLAKRELTGTYEAMNAAELLDVLSRVLDVEVKQTGKNVYVNAR